MSEKPGYGWTQETWNPVVGCTKCSPGCQNCYAERMAKRLKAMGVAKYQDVVDENGWTGKIAFDQDELEKPLKRKKPTLYFVDSMGDLFHANGVQYLDNIHDALYSEEARRHFFLLLTKRIDRFKELNDDFEIIDESVDHIGIGVTVCDQEEANEKIPILLQIPAAMRFVSIESMLGAVDLRGYLPHKKWYSIRCGKCGWAGSTEDCPPSDDSVSVQSAMKRKKSKKLILSIG